MGKTMDCQIPPISPMMTDAPRDEDRQRKRYALVQAKGQCKPMENRTSQSVGASDIGSLERCYCSTIPSDRKTCTDYTDKEPAPSLIILPRCPSRNVITKVSPLFDLIFIQSPNLQRLVAREFALTKTNPFYRPQCDSKVAIDSCPSPIAKYQKYPIRSPTFLPTNLPQADSCHGCPCL